MTTPEYDVLIVGAGSTGLSAALMLARSRRRVLVLDGGRPRNAVSAHMHGVLGRDGWAPLDLVSSGMDEVTRYGATIEHSAASGVETHGDGFTVTLSGGEVRTGRRLLVAGGLRDELPAIAGLAEHWGRGVAHCPYCDGWEARDSRIAVVSTGPLSLHQAQLLRQLSPHVTYFVEGTELPEADLEALVARGIAVENRRIAAVEAGADGITALRLHDGAALPVDTVFVRPRAVPNDALLHRLRAATEPGIDDHDWVIVDATGRTSVPGVWAAGNVVNPAATVPVSSAAGATAGAAINADLVADEITGALERIRA
ncbi:MAG TPA: NAD(P)/FAD-dependent oxidoreductase [Pseudolysinimonas sp.]|nr:NAD(P)/FAD-dependent oxidoreductase [Pseudolysinimonas sp.]